MSEALIVWEDYPARNFPARRKGIYCLGMTCYQSTNRAAPKQLQRLKARGLTKWRTHSNFLESFLHSIETHASQVRTRSLPPSSYLLTVTSPSSILPTDSTTELPLHTRCIPQRPSVPTHIFELWSPYSPIGGSTGCLQQFLLLTVHAANLQSPSTSSTGSI
jgi:hypothetical protein